MTKYTYKVEYDFWSPQVKILNPDGTELTSLRLVDKHDNLFYGGLIAKEWVNLVRLELNELEIPAADKEEILLELVCLQQTHAPLTPDPLENETSN